MAPKSKLVVITPHYPKPNSLYGDVFVHSRLKKYLDHFEVHVVGYNKMIKEKFNNYTYQGISVYETGDRFLFEEQIRQVGPHLIVIHFINEVIIEVVSKLNTPTMVFFHGFDVTSWRRRLMNYDTIGSIRYLIPYAFANIKRLRAIKGYLKKSSHNNQVKPVFVSVWLKEAAEEDLKMPISKSEVIHNGIDTDLFSYKKKDIELRKRILMLRPFSAINYANDISIKTILLLSKEPFFNELQFSIYGDGYLFKRLTSQVSHFSNVTLHNYFIENISIPAVHEKHGIFLCPSRLDSQGVSLGEAMSSGLVPITSPIGGIPEYIDNEVSGYMEKQPEEMAERIKQLYLNPEKFLELSVAASNSILEKCALKNTVQQEIELIKSMLKS
ncbi:MAG: glycosyltransferase family 4 protein [Cyclobacteriaceae bacterium]|nr:glycosyltransferase family 4 protein [Cyclobacteriaceae bacterium]